MGFVRAFSRSLIFALSALACVAISGVAAFAMPPVVAADPTRPSAIEITDSSTHLLQQNGVTSDVVCLAFINHGNAGATKVGFSLALLDATGTVVSVDVMYPTGKFPVGTRSAFSGTRDQAVPNGNCHAVGRSGSPARGSQFVVQPDKNTPPVDIAAIVVSAREIVYQDGTAFRTDQVPQSGDKLALPVAPPFAVAVAAGPPVVTFAAVAGSPVDVTDAFANETYTVTPGIAGGGGLLGVIASMPTTTRLRSYCTTFANRDPRSVKLARMNLAVVDRAGKIIGVDTLDSRGPFAQAAADKPSGIACEPLRGKLNADTFMYQPQDGDAAAAGRIVITPGYVEFVDGATWTAPNPPVAGATIVAP